MNKRIKLAAIATPIVALAAGGIIYAMPDKKPDTQLSTQQTSTVQEVAPTTAVTEQPTTPTPTQTQTVEPEPEPTPAETVASVLASTTWTYDNDRECVNIIRENKPELFATVESTKKLIDILKKSYNTPCAVVGYESRKLIPNYWQKIERQL